ncbi:tRNA preQ1(34) S-adenosylmethionine ribosyltransferase-isomerase QueA [Candidatus Dojkabacteria bacterium]|nr:tRNA preQ1(34) S-adenosylmethionine ribosyltransferase-isomerase QueA [Candidatus Dojkabacteria bacterium]
MKTNQFDYKLPEELIAQYPPENRGGTRLLVIDRTEKKLYHKKYTDIPEYIKEGDVVVLNQTKVINVRTFPKVQRTGSQVEVLFLNNIQYKQNETDAEYWYGLVGRARHVKIGDKLEYPDGEIIEIDHRNEGETGFVIKVPGDRKSNPTESIFQKYGHVPLPPYMRRNAGPEDEVRYNTVFAKKKGSVAAPTASLNLTNEILDRIKEKGAQIAYVNLKIGWGTFAPVKTENVEDFDIHSEYFEITSEAAGKINNAIKAGSDVWAFGTTVTRALESSAVKSDETNNYTVSPGKKSTNLYIYPGYDWKIVDHLITNFHAPKSSLIMLVSSFAGTELIKKAYAKAIEMRYNFLSYGDSTMII